jgi:hypothetical protein
VLVLKVPSVSPSVFFAYLQSICLLSCAQQADDLIAARIDYTALDWRQFARGLNGDCTVGIRLQCHPYRSQVVQKLYWVHRGGLGGQLRILRPPRGLGLSSGACVHCRPLGIDLGADFFDRRLERRLADGVDQQGEPCFDENQPAEISQSSLRRRPPPPPARREVARRRLGCRGRERRPR